MTYQADLSVCDWNISDDLLSQLRALCVCVYVYVVGWGFFAVFLFVYCRLMTLTLSVCVAGKRVQETICLGGSVVLIVFNFCCLLIYFESCYVYSIVAAACKSLIQCHHSLTS